MISRKLAEKLPQPLAHARKSFAHSLFPLDILRDAVRHAEKYKQNERYFKADIT